MENAFIVQGGKALNGEVQLSGAKNVALKTIIAGLMFDGPVTLENIPRINDVLELMHLITILGGKAEFTGKNTVVVDGSTLKEKKVDMLHASKIRVSFMLFAPLLHTFHDCYVPNPGGCRLGARSIDRIIDGMEALGVTADYDSETGYYHASVSTLTGGDYTFTKPTHTGTELLIMLSVIGKQNVVLHNTALEPEIDELIRFLNESGAKVTRNNTDITIEGVESLKSTKPFGIIADRNEAVTFATLALATKGNVLVKGISKHLITELLTSVEKAGGEVTEEKPDAFRFRYVGPLKPVSIETLPHPGFMTDWQPNWAILMTQAEGESTIHERIFENRFSYVTQLRKLGAHIEFITPPIDNPQDYYFFNYDPKQTYTQAIKIYGPQKLHNGVLEIADLRAGATLIIGALLAEGESIIHGASMLERGYEDFVSKVTALGGVIEKRTV